MSRENIILRGVEPEGDYNPNQGRGSFKDNQTYVHSANSKLGLMKRTLLSIILLCSFIPTTLCATSLWVGESMTCDATSSVMGLTSDVSWSVNGGYIALSGSGFYRVAKVTQYFSGTATVTCSWKYRLYSGDTPRTQSCRWTISCNDNPVSIFPTTMTLNVGETGRVYYSHHFTNSYTSAADAYFSTSASCISVSRDGVITALSPGTAYINVYSKVSSEAPYCIVTVRQLDPTRISLPESQKVYVGESATVPSTLYPDGATTTLTWYSRNTAIARVSSGGVVTGVEEGKTSIYAVSANGVTSNDCAVTVDYRLPTSVTISPSALSLPISHTSNLTAKVSPSNAKYELSWSCNRNDIVSVSSIGQITALKAGTAVVTVSTDNGRSGQCTVTVPPDPSGISLSPKVALPWHCSRTLGCVVTPENAYKQLTWSSSEPSVVKVSSNGVLTALAPGTADVTVRTQNGKQATCRVEVDEPWYQFNVWMRNHATLEIDLKDRPLISYANGCLFLDSKSQRLELDTADVYKFTIENKTKDRMPEQIDLIEEMELPLKRTGKLNAVLLPSDYDIQTLLTWESDSPDVVSVSSSGQIKALAPGEALITVTASNGCSAVCRVIVPEPYHHLLVWLKDGRYDAYAFSTRPKIVHEEGELVVTSRVGTYRYMEEQVRKFTLSDSDTPSEPDAITAPSATQQPGGMFRQGETVLMQGLRPGEKLYVYGSDGILRKVLTASEDGRLTFELAGFTAGIYILKTTTTTYKIIKK